MRISKNIASINIYKEYSKNLIKQSSSLQRISSGIKISSAKEDPNGMAKSERFKMQIRGLQMASNNTQDGVSMLQTAEGGLEGITNSLQRVRELLVQAGGVTTDADKHIIQNEIKQMLDGADDMANNTEFNGVKLLSGGNNDGKTSVLPMVIGTNVGEKIDIPKYNLTTEGLGLKTGTTVNVDVDNIGGSLELVDKALNDIVRDRSKFGALENRFQSSYDSITEISDKTQAAESGISDTDMATEIMEYSKDNILIEAANAMMVQSNKLPQDALKVLENVRSR
ncbi:flagellin [Clostridium estertheticum]|uniref:flagellin N-terminal helical domain-containing protein n=1 Tax=Clostridium estertheticum TaxID=238834 RepID=UPI001CF5958E|nr:flagellin [Clostridium estertheticum]MCB2308791.1 flagellin [Clostridium estertheticum]MCB2347131.1 flagellin [Clostridium estertheticum]MCB2351777.1 flagellin [Clostridium estertheticum]WAG44501.1 flagellin [Clostridium estertheticum]